MPGTFLIIGLLLVATWAGESGITPVPDLWLRMGASAAVWLGLLWLSQRRLGRRHSQRRRSLHCFQRCGLFSLVGLYLWWLLELGLAGFSDFGLLRLAPALVLMSVLWWFEAGLAAPGRDPELRRALLAQRWRFGLLLPVLVIALGDALLLLNALPWDQVFGAGSAALIALAGSIGLFLLLTIGIGPVLARLWGARPLGHPWAASVSAIAAHHGLRLQGVWVWPAERLPLYNALAVGLIPPFRSVFISEDLLTSLDATEVDAVLGHELGHLRYHHTPLYLVLLAAGGLAAGWCAPHLHYWLGDLIPVSDYVLVAELLIFAALLLLLVRGLFGIISRACERQADLAGAAAASPRAMQGALRAVTRLSGQALDAPSWRHHSIAERIAFLDRAQRDPGLVFWHHWYVRMLRIVILVSLLLLLTLNIINTFQRPVLGELMENDLDLANAIGQSLAGDNTSFHTWLGEHGDLERQQVAVAVLAHLEQEAGPGLGDPRPLYRYRQVLETFQRLGTGNQTLQRELTNALCYGLVAGTPQPAPDELARAGELADRLERYLSELRKEEAVLPGHIYDTVACVRLRQGRFSDATTYFEQALSSLADVADGDDQTPPALRQLYQQRLAAAEAKTTVLPLEYTPDDDEQQD